MFDFSNRVVMVAGAAGNLGQAVARAFAAANANLVLLGHSSDRLRRIFPQWADSPQHLLFDAVDANDADRVQQVVQAALARLGRVDVLANTVGG